MRSLLDKGLEWVIVSGQPGVELWGAEVVIALRKSEFPHLKLAVLTPFLEQEANWKEAAKEYYRSILSEADFVDSITKRPYSSPAQLQLKNEFILSKAEGLLCLYDEDRLGTPSYYLKIAKEKQQSEQFSIIQINFSDMELVVQEEQDTWSS